ncbi:hypothetical protein B0H19DRAFT_1257186 [Mycena capillaripes]|nr:hypothetical protein B0H19DRAFT_1257186 [Mycena capillaripes]
MRGPCLAIILSLFQLALASTVNITVDDEFGDPNGNKIDYQPPKAWVQGAIGGCSDCPLPSIPSTIAYNNTFHGSLFNQNNNKASKQNQTPFTATFTFFGTYVSVNCIVSDSLQPPVGTSDMTFFIDGVQAETFSHTPTGSSTFQLKTVFVSRPLSLQNHTLIIANGRVGGGNSLAILDSINYSIENNLTSSPTSMYQPATTIASVQGALNKKSNTAAIAGGVIAALAALLLVALTLLYIRHRRNQHRSNVPLSTSILSPFGRIGRFLSGVQGPPKPPPDMAPVPFPSPARHISPSPSPSPSPRPAAPPPPSVGSRMSRISFNANLLVGRFQRRPPPPITTRQVSSPGAAHLSVPVPVSVPVSPALPSGNPLLRQPSAQVEPHNVVTSIQEWQRRTLEETANQPIIHPLDMSEVDLSSHYDESSISGPPPPPAPPPRTPQPPQRRFTVMNN